MPYDKVVDSTVLDAGMTAIANAIRTKGGTSGALSFPSGFVSAVESLSTGGGDTGGTAVDGLKVASGEFVLTEDYTYDNNLTKEYTGSLLIDTGLDEIDAILLFSKEWEAQTAERPCFGVSLYINSNVHASKDARYPSNYGLVFGFNATTSNWYGASSTFGAVLNNMASTVPKGSFGFKCHATTYPIKAGQTIKWVAVQGFKAMEVV